MIENEIKFKIRKGNVSRIRKQLISLNPKKVLKYRQIDYSFAGSEKMVLPEAALLRVRKQGKDTIITFKGPVIPSKFKKRKEINIFISNHGKSNNFKKTIQLFTDIGLRPLFQKEKIREEFVFNKTNVCLDKLPFIGFYCEIEGSNKDIVKIAKKLGFSQEEKIKESYSKLFSLFCIIHSKEMKKQSSLECSFKNERAWRKEFKNEKR